MEVVEVVKVVAVLKVGLVAEVADPEAEAGRWSSLLKRSLTTVQSKP